MINRKNYEEYFLDFHEGNLSPSMKEAVRIFLDENPDLKDEFERFSPVKLEAETEIVFPSLNSLKREIITRQNYKTWLVAAFEGDLSKDESAELEKFMVANPSVRTEEEMIRHTRILPDTKIIFSGKRELKRGGKIISIPNYDVVRRMTAIAASLLFILISWYLLRRTTEQKTQEAERKTPVQQITPDATQKLANAQAIETKPFVPTGEKKVKSSVRSSNREQHLAKNTIQHTLPSLEVPGNPVVAENKKDSVLVNEKNNPEEEITQRREKRKTDLKTLFTPEDIRDMGLTASAPVSEPTGFWKTMESGAKTIEKITGKDLVKNNSGSLALQVGDFSVQHVPGN